MKKLFLIPLMTLLSCVMAWGVEVATLAELQAAVPTTTGSAEITLTGDISTDATALTVPEGVTVTLNLNNHSITVEKTLAEFSQDLNSGLDAIVVNEGATLTVNGAGAITCHFIYTDDYFSFDGGRAITSNGTLTLIGDVDITGGAMGALNAATTSTVNIGPDFIGTVTGGLNLPSSCVSGGYWESSPQMWLASGYVTEEENGLFHVIESDVVYVAMNEFKEVSYETLEAAINAAEDGDYIILLADAPATVVSKEIGIDAHGFDYSLITAGEGYVYEDEVDEDWDIAMRSFYTKAHYAGYQLRDFLVQEEDGSYVLTEDADISNIYGIEVVGNKTLTIPAGKKILYQSQAYEPNILVNDGAKLTILGNGSVEPVHGTEMETDETNQTGCWAIRVDGELVVGVKDADQPHFVSTAGRISGVDNFHGAPIYITESGKATINNIDIHAAQATFWNAGETTINGGEFISVSSSQSGLGAYSYALQNYGKMVINDIHVQGTHGGFACQNFHTDEDVATGFAEAANTVINGGTFETVHGKNFITGVDNAKDNYYAMYVSNFGIVNVYGGKFKVQTPSAGSNRVVLIGNNDYYNSYGIVNFYGGMYAEKAYVTKKKNAESAFPPSIPLTSAWYSAFEVMNAKNAYAPLPAGYEYYETGDATYPYGVRVIAGKAADVIDPDKQAAQEADPTYTIPWQQATTWATDEVPVENTIVTIPVDATVTVSKDEATKTAVADQVFVSQGATLKVEEGTTLTVGESGMNIAHGGQLVVEAGATVKIGAAGVITTEEDALVIESSAYIQGALLYDPSVDENTQPKATVRLTTKCYQKNASYEYQWQRFAIPLMAGSSPVNNYTDQALFSGETEFETYLFAWSNAGSTWVQPDGWASLVPHKGYQIANNIAKPEQGQPGIVYSFTGNLVGNQDGAYPFDVTGFEFFGNSYTAPIYVPKLLEGLSEQGQEGIYATVYIYDVALDQFITMTPQKLQEPEMYDEDEYKEEIASMQAFIIKGNAGATAEMSYKDAIWENPRFDLSNSNDAPQRRSSINYDLTLLKVTANGKQDMLSLRQRDDFSAEYDNGADAFKYMNEGTFNIYANTEIGDLAEVSTDELNNTILGFQSAEATEYTLTCSGQKGESFILRDLLTGAEVNLEKGATYTFAQQPNTTNEARFQIVEGRMAPTAVENVQNVKKAEGIYTVLGKYLGAADQLDKLPAGMYIVNGVKIVK